MTVLSEQRAALRAEYRRAGFYGDRTLDQAIESGGTQFANDSIVFIRGGERLETTVGALYRSATSFAAGLQAHGIGPGDRVAVQLPNSPECYIAHLAVVLTGATLVPIVPIYGVKEVGFILCQSAAKMLIMPSRLNSTDYTTRVSDFLSVESLEELVVVGNDVPSDCLAWGAVATEGAYRYPAASADAICLLLYTSGTTSDPKGVLHTHNSVLAELTNTPVGGRFDADYVNLVAFPAGHIAGVINIYSPAVFGGRTIFMDSWDPQTAADLIDEYSVSATSGTPYHLQSLIHAARGTDKLATLRGYLLGAATVTDELVHQATAAGVTTYRTYGATEHPTITACSLTDPVQARMQTEGSPLPGCEVRIVDEWGNDLPMNAQGEIVVRGPEQFAGYEDPALTAAAFFDGCWLRTGDVGYLDADNRLHITDRLKDIVIRGGENISSLEVENILATHPSAREVAVVAAPDTRYGEIVCAVVIPEPGSTLDLDEVRRHFAASGAAKQKTPERIVLLDEFPRTPLGKIRKADLRRQVAAGHRSDKGDTL